MESTSIPLSSRIGTRRNWVELPSELTASILTRLGSVDLLISARKVCKTWRRICSDSDMWRVVDMRYTSFISKRWSISELFDNPDMEEAAKQAVALSCGQMVDCNVEYFGSNDLIRYISERSCQLSRLRLVSCYRITDEGLIQMVKNLPLLEELHLSDIHISKQATEVLARCCPQLKSFSLRRVGYIKALDFCDDEALAISQNMPGLRHLQLLGNKMTHDGLLAILNNCVHLESLDIRNCPHLKYYLASSLSQERKDLRLIYDMPNEDSEFYSW